MATGSHMKVTPEAAPGGRLKRIVDAIGAQSSGVQARLMVARVGLKAGVNLSRITPATPDNPAMEQRILRAAEQVIGRPIVVD